MDVPKRVHERILRGQVAVIPRPLLPEAKRRLARSLPNDELVNKRGTGLFEQFTYSKRRWLLDRIKQTRGAVFRHAALDHQVNMLGHEHEREQVKLVTFHRAPKGIGKHSIGLSQLQQRSAMEA